MSDNNTTMNNQNLRVLMFPWLGYGHITPYLELAKKLSARNFIVYLCSTKATLASIEDKINGKLSDSIKLVTLFLTATNELPSDLHTTNGLPSHLMPKLKEAFDASAPQFAEILVDTKPDLLIYDFLQPWAPLAAKEQNIPAVEFITSSSTSTSFMFHYYHNPRDVDFPYRAIYFRDYEAHYMKRLIECASNPKEKESASEGVNRSCNIVLIKGFREIEDKYIDYVTRLVEKKFVPVGPLIQTPSPRDLDEQRQDVLKWLDEKETKSSVFVSFGSEFFLSKEDMHEIAYGLELSNINFIWVIRFPKGQSEKSEKTDQTLLEEALPLGFLDKIRNKGKIIVGWAPQTKILGHTNIGGFVSHCGWNSVIESMEFGVPIIAVPMHLDQPINARLMEEVGVGVEAVKDAAGRLRRETLAAIIKQVVIEDEGEAVRQKAKEMKEKIGAKREEEIDEVVKELLELCKKS